MGNMVQVKFGNTLVNRVEPAMPSHAYKTYGWSMPLKTHWVAATCEEVECEAHAKGWVTTLDISTELGQQQYYFCKHDATRRFTERQVSAQLVELTYAAGNICFLAGDHKRPLERPAIFTVKDGDWRGNPRRTDIRVHTSVENWVDDFTTHQDRLTAEIEKG